MNYDIKNSVFTRTIEGFGTIHLRPLDLELDLPTIYNWVTKPYASYWGMTDKTCKEVYDEYKQLTFRSNHEVYIGIHKNKPIFLMEKYKAIEDRIATYYAAKDTDYGMHILVAPPKQKIHGFTWNIFSTVLTFFFSQSYIERIIVEPDVRNEKIHALNKKAGFKYQKEIELPEKKAALAFCIRSNYEMAKQAYDTNAKMNRKVTSGIEESISYLSSDPWQFANRFLLRKALSEFLHEVLLTPVELSNDVYRVHTDTPSIFYEFKALRKALDHWDIDEKTITKRNGSSNVALDALSFIIECRQLLGIPEHLLAVYLEEMTSTLSSLAYKYQYQELNAKELAKASFQRIEHAMIEGHPCFVANSGRIGFDIEDYKKYAPEVDEPFTIFWLAGHKENATYTGIRGCGYNKLMHTELGVSKIAQFNAKLKELGLDAASYIFIPVHPWQWENKITQVFAADIANRKLVFLGESMDLYSAQQSIRTLYNTDHPEKMYTKTALSIYNMGFMRGLSPYYMKSTPVITEWITKLLKDDPYLKRTKFTMLGEVATVGYENRYYEVLGKTNTHNKMLSALWREGPHSKIKPGEQLMTMAALLHVDREENSLLAALIKSTGQNIHTWVQRYLQAYLSPLLHCFYRYDLVFMPHGENIIMVLQDHTPRKILMKDITEEVIIFCLSTDMPEEVKRLYTKTSDTMKVLALFTDIFDSFFRFLSAILDKHLGYAEDAFWEQVATCIYDYQEQHPELQEKFKKYDLFVPEFDRCCLNRLQLRNTKQMLNLADPIDSLILEGVLENPIAKYKKFENKEKRLLQEL